MEFPRLFFVSRRQVTFVVGMMLTMGFWCEAPAQLPGFTQVFDPNTSKIRVQPVQNRELFHRSDTVSISTSDGSSVRVFNLGGTTVYQGTPGALPALPVDHYFVECPGDRAQFCVLPDDYEGASFLSVDKPGGIDSTLVEQLNQDHPMWIRALSDGQWYIVEPMSGVWNWELLDKMVAANLGCKIIVSAFIRPSWVTDRSQFLPQFLTYVTAMAQRYDGKIYAIQIWNEPYVQTVTANGPAWGDIGNPLTGNMDVDFPVWEQTLATLIAASRQAIRGVSSSIKVFGPDWQSLNYARLVPEFADLVGNQTLDAYTFHAGTQFPTTPLSDWDDETNELQNFIIPYVGNASWMVTEFYPFGASALGIPRNGALPGVPSSGINWQRGTDRVIQSVVTWRAGGAEAIIPHCLPLAGTDSVNNNWEVFGWEWGMGSYSRGPHPKTSAYLMSGYWLNNATLVDARTPGQKVFLYAWKRPDNSSLVFAWTAEGLSAPLQPNPAFTVTDIFGHTNQINELTESPALFSSTTLSPSVLMNNILQSLTQNYSVPPVWRHSVDNQSVQAGQSLQFTVSVFDLNRAPVTYTASPLPAGASMNPHTGTFTWTPTGAQIGSYEVTITAADDQGKSAATSTTIDVVGDLFDGLAHHWKFDEGTGLTAADSAGHADGTFVNFTSGWTNGVDGNALSFDGTRFFVSLPNDELNFTNNFTVAAWIYPRQASGEGAFLAVQCSYQETGLRFFVVQNSLSVQGQTTSGWKGTIFGDGSISSDVWHHFVVVYDKSTVRAYIDGVYQGSSYWGGDLVMNPNLATQVGTQSGYFFDGVIDELMIFNRTLSGQEASRLYDSINGPPVTPPTLAPVGAKKVLTGQILAFQIFATDENSAPLTYSAKPLPAGATFDASNRLFMWTPQSGQAGSHNLTFAVSNGQLTDSETISIAVTSSNRAPVLKAIKPKRVRAGHRIRVTLKAKDPDHNPLVYSVSPLPSGATFDPVRHRFEWIPTAEQIGQHDLTASVTDGSANDNQLMSIIVY